VGTPSAATDLSNGLAGSPALASQVAALEDGELAELVPLGDAEVVAAQPVEFAPKYFSDIREHFVSC
jgi:hypothetical protein